MAGLLTPYTCYDLVKKLKETVSIPVDIHSHYTAGQMCIRDSFRMLAILYSSHFR